MLTAFQETKFTYLFNLLDLNKDGKIRSDDFLDISNAIAQSFNLDPNDRKHMVFQARSKNSFRKLLMIIPITEDDTIFLKDWLDFFDNEVINGDDNLATDEIVDLMLNIFFYNFDENRDGYTSIREYILMFSILGISKRDLTAAFIKFDINGDLKLSRYELMSYIEAFLISDDISQPGNWIFGPMDYYFS